MDQKYRPQRNNAGDLGARILGVVDQVVCAIHATVSPQYALAGNLGTNDPGYLTNPSDLTMAMQKGDQKKSRNGHLHIPSKMITVHIPHGTNVSVPRNPEDLRDGETLIGYIVRKYGVAHRIASKAIRRAAMS